MAPTEAPSPARLVGILLAIALAIAVVLVCFLLPASRSAPRDLPIGVAGPAQVTGQVSAAVESGGDGGFAVTAFQTTDRLVAAIENREIYGGAAPTESTAYVASGASPTVAMRLRQAFTEQLGAGGRSVQVRELAPLGPDDPTGAGFGGLVMPMFLSGMVAGLAASIFVRSRAHRAIALPVAAVALGAVIAGVAAGLGVVDGARWFAVGCVAALSILAIAASVAGLRGVLGPPGIGVAAVAFLIVGMPLAGFATAPEFLPGFWSGLGQALPLGAAGQALRGAAYFEGAGWGMPLSVLTAYAVVGLALVACGPARDNGQVPNEGGDRGDRVSGGAWTG